MRKPAYILLLFFVLFSFAACHQDHTAASDQLNFYYLRADILYGAEDGVICAEAWDSGNTNPDDLMERYLLGPVSDYLVSPFPKGTQIKSIKLSGNSLLVYLSNDFLSLTGLDHTLACACLAKTCFSVYNISEITIRIEGSDQSTTLTPDSLTLMDAEDIIHATIGVEIPTP